MQNFGLIGKKLGHSYASDFFNAFFQKEGLTDHRYTLFELTTADQLKELVESDPNLKGLNVTIPYKHAVIPMMNELSPEAAAIGAVNCIVIRRTGGRIKMLGHNTDAGGFTATLKNIPTGKAALVLGSGGASRAVVYVLEQMGMKVYVVSRDPAKGVVYSALNAALIAKVQLVVNTTPLGMHPDTRSCPEIPYSALGPEHLCYDLVYNPPETTFMRNCKASGARVVNGQAMLEAQAMLSWDFWKGWI